MGLRRKIAVFIWTGLIGMLLCTNVCASSVTESDTALDQYLSQTLDELWAELSPQLPSQAQEAMDEVEIDGISSLLSMTPGQLIEQVLILLRDQLDYPMEVVGRLIAIVLLCAMVQAVCSSSLSQQLQQIFSITAVACMVSFLSQPVLQCIERTVQALHECALFMMSFAPVMSSVVIAGGNPASAGSYNLFLFFACQVIAQLASQTLVPLLSIYLALCIVGPLAPFLKMDSITGAIRSVVCWGLGILTTIFVGMLSLQTVISTGGDSLLLKTSRFLAGSFIPVIGGTISDALGAARGCVQVMKSVIGSAGIAVAALTFLPVLLEVGLWYLAVKVSAWAAQMLDAKQGAALLLSIAQTFSVLLAMIVCFMLLVLVSTALLMMLTVG